MFMPLIGKHSIQYANGANGRKKRQILDRSFSHGAISSYATVFDEVCVHAKLSYKITLVIRAATIIFLPGNLGNREKMSAR